MTDWSKVADGVYREFRESEVATETASKEASLLARIEVLETIVIAYSKMLEHCAVGQAITLEEQVRTAIADAKES